MVFMWKHTIIPVPRVFGMYKFDGLQHLPSRRAQVAT